MMLIEFSHASSMTERKSDFYYVRFIPRVSLCFPVQPSSRGRRAYYHSAHEVKPNSESASMIGCAYIVIRV